MSKLEYVTGHVVATKQRVHVAVSAITHVLVSDTQGHVASIGDPGTPGAPLEVQLDAGEWEKIC